MEKLSPPHCQHCETTQVTVAIIREHGASDYVCEKHFLEKKYGSFPNDETLFLTDTTIIFFEWNSIRLFINLWKNMKISYFTAEKNKKPYIIPLPGRIYFDSFDYTVMNMRPLLDMEFHLGGLYKVKDYSSFLDFAKNNHQIFCRDGLRVYGKSEPDEATEIITKEDFNTLVEIQNCAIKKRIENEEELKSKGMSNVEKKQKIEKIVYISRPSCDVCTDSRSCRDTLHFYYIKNNKESATGTCYKSLLMPGLKSYFKEEDIYRGNIVTYNRPVTDPFYDISGDDLTIKEKVDKMIEMLEDDYKPESPFYNIISIFKKKLKKGLIIKEQLPVNIFFLDAEYHLSDVKGAVKIPDDEYEELFNGTGSVGSGMKKFVEKHPELFSRQPFIFQYTPW